MQKNDVKKILFHHLDNKNRGKVQIVDILTFLNEPQSLKLAVERLMRLLGENFLRRHEVQFGEFARSLSTQAMFGSTEILKAFFSSFDNGGYGFISKTDYVNLLNTLHLKGGAGAAVLRALQESDSISFPEFMDVNMAFPNVLFPLFRLQQAIRDKLLGRCYWNHKMKLMVAARVFVRNHGM